MAFATSLWTWLKFKNTLYSHYFSVHLVEWHCISNASQQELLPFFAFLLPEWHHLHIHHGVFLLVMFSAFDTIWFGDTRSQSMVDLQKSTISIESEFDSLDSFELGLFVWFIMQFNFKIKRISMKWVQKKIFIIGVGLHDIPSIVWAFFYWLSLSSCVTKLMCYWERET